jgi:AAA+ ATPase superfamily predicted ATPase
MANWEFYGRTEPLTDLRRIVESPRWFFCRIEGRRRIGKTTLLGQIARTEAALGANLVYMQVPDSDERDVAATFGRRLSECEQDLAQRLAVRAWVPRQTG